MAYEDSEMFEQVLGFHAAPTLRGLKASSLISFRKSSFEDFEMLLASYEPCLQCKGISVYRVSEGDEYVLLLFYRREAMRRHLYSEKSMHLLERYGYRREDTLDDMLCHLRLRMKVRKTFPHEIGLFLGYPPEDVAGFIKYKGKNFCYSGYWKVYANEERTRELFNRYTECSHCFCTALENGRNFQDLVCAV